MRSTLLNLTLILITFQPLSTFADPDVSILYHESLELLEIGRASDGSVERLTFDAFGRRFSLRIESSRAGAAGSNAQLLKARLANAPDAWARLTLRGETLTGIIDEDGESYIIEQRQGLDADLLVQNERSDSPSIIYRLSDTLVTPGLLACDDHREGELPNQRVNGKTAYAKLTAEIGAASDVAETGGYVATVDVIADSHMFEWLGEDTEVFIQDLFATVDGIYSAQVGVAIEPVTIDVSTSLASDPVSDHREGSGLLDGLGNWRRSHQPMTALTHLVTNRRLQNDQGQSIAGISFLGSPGRSGVCDARTGVSISEWIGSGMTALVIAHELGHNFGAKHDGERAEQGDPPNPCEYVGSDEYLMSPMLRSGRNDRFSQCSLEQMDKVIAAASCLSSTLRQEASVSSGGASGLHWTVPLALMVAARIRRRRMPDPSATGVM
ncbi:MAG: hypothetical protein HKN81_02870 [Gammaproteobacteria bacterium]|nr:hypothetical protein [Gammaproteobacteria bacterium]NND36055.1 hypothetical protein [Gammaproteobacteria bacterium]